MNNRMTTLLHHYNLGYRYVAYCPDGKMYFATTEKAAKKELEIFTNRPFNKDADFINRVEDEVMIELFGKHPCVDYSTTQQTCVGLSINEMVILSKIIVSLHRRKLI